MNCGIKLTIEQVYDLCGKYDEEHDCDDGYAVLAFIIGKMDIGDEKLNGWKKISNKPLKSGHYLVTDGQEVERWLYDAESESWHADLEGPEFYPSDIEYWMTMPEPPQDSDQEG